LAELIFEYDPIYQADEVMVDDDWVYWSNGDGLWRIHKYPDTFIEKVGPNGMVAMTLGLAQDDDRVYWAYRPDVPTPGSPSQLVAVAKQSLEASYLDVGEIDPVGGALLVDGGTAYLASASCEALASVPVDGGQSRIWPVHDHGKGGGSTGMAIDDQYVYCGTGFSQAYGIQRIDRADGSVVELVSPPSDRRLRGVGGLAVDEDFVYWLEIRSTPFDGDIELLRRAKAEAGPGTALANVPEGTLNQRLLLMGSRIYWDNGSLQRFDLQRQEYRYLLEGPISNRGDIATDGEYIYWLTVGRVYRASVAALEAHAIDAPPVHPTSAKADAELTSSDAAPGEDR
jgi:hypothetical protein